jgi:excisionase family DNA binding protein
LAGTSADPVLLFENMPTESSSTIDLLTIAEVARLLKISTSGVRRLQQARQLPFIKVGGGVRFLTRDIIEYVEKQRVKPVG